MIIKLLQEGVVVSPYFWVVIKYSFKDDVEAQMEIYKCFEDSECGNCTTLFHMTNDLHWHGSRGFKEKTERPVHYLSNKIQHPSKYRIVECTEKCFCFNNSCTNRAVANLKDNPFPFAKEFKFFSSKMLTVFLISKTLIGPTGWWKFINSHTVIFKSADARGWGLKCLIEIPKGSPVIEVFIKKPFKLIAQAELTTRATIITSHKCVNTSFSLNLW